MATTYRFTAFSNAVGWKQSARYARPFPIAVNEDIQPGDIISVFPVTGNTSGTATLVRRENGVNGSGKTITSFSGVATRNWLSISALWAGVIDTTLVGKFYEMKYT